MTEPAPVPTPPAGDPPTPPTPPADPATPPAPPADPSTGDKPLGPGGEKALAAEREARKALEKELAPLKQLAQALGGQPTGDGKTDLERLTERLTQHETELAAERSARYRAEVAAAKGLTSQQAARLQGATREELEADADALLALFPTAPAGPRNPAPDPSQGARGAAPNDLDARIAEAAARGDHKAMIALKAQKLASLKPTN